MCVVYEINPLQDRRWESFVERHPRSSVFHRAKWLRALKRVYGYEPVAFTSCSPDSPLTNAIAFCKVRSALTGNRLVSLPFSDHCEPLVNSGREMEALIAEFVASGPEKGWKYVEIRPVTASPAGFSISETYLFHTLSLIRPEAELFQSFHRDCIRRKIARAERESIEYDEGYSEAHLQRFYRLMVMTRRRHRLPPQPLAWFRALAAGFGRDLRIRFALSAGTPIASILTLSHRKVLTYKYACSDARVHNLGGPAFLLWKTIQKAKLEGFEELDLGRSSEDQPGLIAFKEHWGAQRSRLAYWRYPPGPPARRLPQAMSALKKFVPLAPDRSLVLIGRVLYRHIG